MTTTISVLDREMFSEAEAARLLEVPQSTLQTATAFDFDVTDVRWAFSYEASRRAA